MSLLFCDSFAHYATADILTKYTDHNFASIVAAGNGRHGGPAMQFAGSTSGYATKAVPAASTIIQGAAVRPNAAASVGTIFSLFEGSTAHLALRLLADGRFEVRRGTGTGTVIATSASAVSWPSGVYGYVEWKATIHDTTGSVEVRFNGQTMINVSGVDTRNGGTTGLIDSVKLCAPSDSLAGFAAGLRFCDYIICDGAGSTNNTLLGDVRVDCYLPTSDGANTGLTPSTGTSHFALVDEATPNTTDYNSGDTVGLKDTYGMADMTHTPVTIFGVQTMVAALKDDGGSRSIKTLARSGGTDYQGSELVLAAGVNYARTVREVDPATSAAWTKTGLNAAEFGAEVTA